MPRDRAKILLLLTLATLIAVSLLPRRWLSWTNDAAGIVRIPIAPAGHLGTVIGSWLRPAHDPLATLPADVQEQVRTIQEERDRFEKLYHQSELRICKLQEQVRQLQLVNDLAHRPTDLRLIHANINGRHPSDSFGAVTVNAGQRLGVHQSAIAVYMGVHLVGRVTDVERVSSLVRPLAARATGAIRSKVWPADRPDVPASEVPDVRLEPDGQGLFVGDVDRTRDVEVGDEVRLVDPAWPGSAQMLKIGVVDQIRPKDQQPLRNQIVVRPTYQLHELASVVLLIESRRDEQGVAGSRAEQGSLRELASGRAP